MTKTLFAALAAAAFAASFATGASALRSDIARFTPSEKTDSGPAYIARPRVVIDRQEARQLAPRSLYEIPAFNRDR